MNHTKRYGVFLAIAILIVLITSSCNYVATVANGSARTTSGATNAAAVSGPKDPVTNLVVKEAAILAGTTNLTHVTGPITIGSNCTSSGKCTGSGTSADPFIYKNKWVTGCIAVEVPWVTIQDVYVDWRNPNDNWGDHCHAGNSTGSDGAGSGISTGNINNTVIIHDVKLIRTEVSGNDVAYNDVKIAVGGIGFSLIQDSDIHGGLVTIWVGNRAEYPLLMINNYIHHVSQAHTNEAPDHLCVDYAVGTPQCIDDEHRELVRTAGDGWVGMYSNYIDMELTGVTYLGHSIECTSAVFTGYQFWGSTDLPGHDVVISNNYIDSGGGCSEINHNQKCPGTPCTTIPINYNNVWEHNTFHSGGNPNNDWPCGDVNVDSTYTLPISSTGFAYPTKSNSYNNKDENGNLVANC